MHAQVLDWVAARLALVDDDLARRGLDRSALAVLEVGSLDINGTVRPLLAGVGSYHGIDLVAGPGVDEVADAAHWEPPRTYGLALCLEVLEHAPAWPAVLATMWAALAPGGLLLVTCAADGRAPHSAVDGLAVRPDEHYANVPATALVGTVRGLGARHWSVTWAAARGDAYLAAQRPHA